MGRKKILLVLAATIAAVVVAALLFRMFMSNEAVLPKEVQRKANFSIYALDGGGEAYRVDKTSINYDDKNNILMFTVKAAAYSAVITQQATPESFSVVPGGYQKLLESMRQYKEVRARLGTVTLTKPEELKGQQIAVANPPGTLIFAKPDKELSVSQVQQLFDNLLIVR